MVRKVSLIELGNAVQVEDLVREYDEYIFNLHCHKLMTEKTTTNSIEQYVIKNVKCSKGKKTLTKAVFGNCGCGLLI